MQVYMLMCFSLQIPFASRYMLGTGRVFEKLVFYCRLQANGLTYTLHKAYFLLLREELLESAVEYRSPLTCKWYIQLIKI
jgi:hypothetical protein